MDFSISDKNLVEAIRNGSKQAFDDVYLKYHRMLYTIAFRYLSPAEEAEDSVAGVFVRFWEMRREIVVETSLKNYLYTMTKNNLLNKLRKSKPVFLSIDCAESYQDENMNALDELFEKKEIHDRLYSDVIKFRSHVGWKQDAIWTARPGLTDEAKDLAIKKLESAETRFPVFWGPGFDRTPDVWDDCLAGNVITNR